MGPIWGPLGVSGPPEQGGGPNPKIGLGPKNKGVDRPKRGVRPFLGALNPFLTLPEPNLRLLSHFLAHEHPFWAILAKNGQNGQK